MKGLNCIKYVYDYESTCTTLAEDEFSPGKSM